MKDLLTWQGRMNRQPYILWTLVLWALSIGISQLSNPNKFNMPLLALMLLIPLAVFGVFITIRRLHDIDKTGWISLIGFIPLINLIFAIYLFVAKGTSGPNRFGPDPIGAA